jgi:hypothetical protein
MRKKPTDTTYGASYGTSYIWLAWAGWMMKVPPKWRPLKIEDKPASGKVILGDSSQAVAQIKWSNSVGRNFDADQWLRQRIKAVACDATTVENEPALEDFEQAAWLSEASTSKTSQRSLWYGYAPKARLLLEIVINGEIDEKTQKIFRFRVLPSLRICDKKLATKWAIFDVSFESPAGFTLKAKRLNVGDMALELTNSKVGRLLVRQVYPASLALQRRKLEKWVRSYPHKEHRRYKSLNEAEKWKVESFERNIDGLICRGQKRLPFPLGFCAPRFTISAISHDAGLDRLLIAEYDGKKPEADNIISDIISRMNWARFE